MATKKPTKAQLELKGVIEEYKEQYGRYPEVENMMQITGKSQQAIMNTLRSISDYPDDMRLTPYEKRFLEAYEPGMDAKGVGEKLGLSQTQYVSKMRTLIEKGFIPLSPEMKMKRQEKVDKPQYIKVKDGIVNAGHSGYIKDVADMPICVLWINGREVQDLKYHFEELILY